MQLQCATQNQKSKNVCCLCCKSGPVTGKIRVDRIGHVPGDTVRFQSEIQNLTNRVCKSYVKFYMVTPPSLSLSYKIHGTNNYVKRYIFNFKLYFLNRALHFEPLKNAKRWPEK